MQTESSLVVFLLLDLLNLIVSEATSIVGGTHLVFLLSAISPIFQLYQGSTILSPSSAEFLHHDDTIVQHQGSNLTHIVTAIFDPANRSSPELTTFRNSKSTPPPPGIYKQRLRRIDTGSILFPSSCSVCLRNRRLCPPS